jgi:hypothetical protein
MEHPATTLARELAGQAERICRRYLSNGHREGSYWLVGDLTNAPGRSLYVRLRASPDGTGRPGKWVDAQSGEHGDLLDIIRASTASGSLREALDEARRLLSRSDNAATEPPSTRARPGSADAARRLLALTRPIIGTLAEAYLASRGILASHDQRVLRFHPSCWYRRSRHDHGPVPDAMPAMIASVTDIAGNIVGAHRTWLAPDGADKALVASPRRAMGNLLGHGVRFGDAGPVMIAGEGIETMLSSRTALPHLPAIAALSAAHLGAIAFPNGLRRLYVAREADPAGRSACARLAVRAENHGVELLPLDSIHGDLNADLRALGLEAFTAAARAQLCPDDRLPHA